MYLFIYIYIYNIYINKRYPHIIIYMKTKALFVNHCFTVIHILLVINNITIVYPPYVGLYLFKKRYIPIVLSAIHTRFEILCPYYLPHCNT